MKILLSFKTSGTKKTNKSHPGRIESSSVINMGTKVYNYQPKFLNEMDDYKAFKKELKTIPSSSNFLVRGRICIFLMIYL
jgi:hypothetical protein